MSGLKRFPSRLALGIGLIALSMSGLPATARPIDPAWRPMIDGFWAIYTHPRLGPEMFTPTSLIGGEPAAVETPVASLPAPPMTVAARQSVTMPKGLLLTLPLSLALAWVAMALPAWARRRLAVVPARERWA